MENDEIFVVGKMRLNPVSDKRTPVIELIMDTASGRTDGEIILLKQVATQNNEYYFKKISK